MNGESPSEFSNSHTEFCKEVFQPGILTIVHKELICKIARLSCRGIISQKFISINSLILLRFSVGKRVTFFDKPPAPNEPTASVVLEMCMQEVVDLHIANFLSPTNRGRFVAHMAELERNTQNFAIPTPRLVRKFPAWNPPSHAEAAHPQNCAVELQRNQEMHLD